MNKAETITPAEYEHLLRLMDDLEQAAIDDMARGASGFVQLSNKGHGAFCTKRSRSCLASSQGFA